MVLLKRTSDNGFNSHHSAAIPRAPRSIRKKGLRSKATEGGGICAFDLLATVAGKLLEENECSSASSSAAVGFDPCGMGRDAVKKELQDVQKQLGGEHDEQGSSEGSVFHFGIHRDIFKGKLGTMCEAIGEHASALASSACSMKIDSDSKPFMTKGNCGFVKLAGSIERNSPKCGEPGDTNVEEDINGGTVGDSTMTNKAPAPTHSEENVKVPICGGSNSNASFLKLKLGNDVKIDCKDDDEILSHYSTLNSSLKAYESPTHIGDPKLKRLLTSKYWNSGPKLKEYEHSNPGAAAKNIYQDKRSCYDIDRSQRDTPFKKRKLFDRSSVVTYGGGISCESVSNSPEKSLEDDKNAPAGKLREGKGNGISSSAFGRQKSCTSRNSHVRLSIKSFEVPELFIEVPESTTVSSLKRTVLEAVTSVLGGGLRVGVLVHGKKIRDDKTLFQTGISQNEDMNSIGFMLEPDSPTQPSQPTCSKESPSQLPCDSPKFVNSSQINPIEDMFLLDSLDKPYMTDSNSPVGSTGDLLPSPVTEQMDKNCSDSRALVPVPDASKDALAVVPMNPKLKRSEIGQRRTRRPFSVSEVEALVEAVEKLGTGRWRDVKLCAFENAKHRTYVDLKDKWKTLVHTARISPQQRRGEPVPQELLDRVLAAQSYWSEHQTKQHGKQQQAIIPKLTDSTAVKA